MASSSCLSERASAFDEAADSTFGAQRGAAHRMQAEEVSAHRVHSKEVAAHRMQAEEVTAHRMQAKEVSAHRMQAEVSTHQIHSDEVAVHRMESEDGIQDRRRLRGVSEVVDGGSKHSGASSGVGDGRAETGRSVESASSSGRRRLPTTPAGPANLLLLPHVV